MKQRRTRAVVLWTVAATLLALVVSAVVGHRYLLEAWYLRQLGSTDDGRTIDAAEQLGSLGSRRAVDKLLFHATTNEELWTQLFEAFGPRHFASLSPFSVERGILLLEREDEERLRARAFRVVAAVAAERGDGILGLVRGGIFRSADEVYDLVEIVAPVAAESPQLMTDVVERLDDPKFHRELSAPDPSGNEAIAPPTGVTDRWAIDLPHRILVAAFHEAPASLDVLLEGLDHPTARVRVEVCRVVGVLGLDADAAAPRLVMQLDDPEPKVRAAAARALHPMGDAAHPALPRLVSLLDTDFPEIADTVVAVLVGQWAESAILDRFEGASETFRLRAVEVFSRRYGKLSSELLTHVFDPSPAVRRAMMECVARRGDGSASAFASVLGRLKDDDAVVRAEAAKTLGSIRGPAYQTIALLVATLSEPDDDVVHVAAKLALENVAHRSPNAFKSYTKDLKQAPPKRAQNALVSAAGIAGDTTPLVTALSDAASETRLAAAFASERLIVAESLTVTQLTPALLERLADEDSEVAKVAAQALGSTIKIHGDQGIQSDFVKQLIAAVESTGNSPVRHRAALALAHGGEHAAPAVPALLKILEVETDATVQENIALALGEIGAEAEAATAALSRRIDGAADSAVLVMRNAIARLLQRSDKPLNVLTASFPTGSLKVRSTLLECLILAESKAPQSAQLFRDALKAPETRLRRHAVSLLGDAPAMAVELLNSVAPMVTGDAAWEVREAAANSLGHLGIDAINAVPQLAKALEDRVPNVRETAAIALSYIARATPMARDAIKQELAGASPRTERALKEILAEFSAQKE